VFAAEVKAFPRRGLSHPGPAWHRALQVVPLEVLQDFCLLVPGNCLICPHSLTGFFVTRTQARSGVCRQLPVSRCRSNAETAHQQQKKGFPEVKTVTRRFQRRKRHLRTRETMKMSINKGKFAAAEIKTRTGSRIPIKSQLKYLYSSHPLLRRTVRHSWGRCQVFGQKSTGTQLRVPVLGWGWF
jgi:hypothetical protein